MPTNLVVPPLGESVTEAVLLRWIKNDGDAVAQGEAVAELETDKANVDLPATVAGRLRHGKAVGDTVKVGETVATVEQGAGAAATGAAPPGVTASNSGNSGNSPAAAAAPAAGGAAASTQPENLSPAVRPLVEENHLDAASVSGTGRGGRVTKEDVVKHLADRTASSASPEAAGRTTSAPSAAAANGGNGNATPTSSTPPAPPAPRHRKAAARPRRDATRTHTRVGLRRRRHQARSR